MPLRRRTLWQRGLPLWELVGVVLCNLLIIICTFHLLTPPLSGVGHEDLVRLATSTFGSMPEGDSVTLAQADFVGGMLPNTSPHPTPPLHTPLRLPAD